MKVIVFDLDRTFNPIFKSGNSDMKRIEDFYVKVDGQLYNRINVCEDTEDNRLKITLGAKLIFDARRACDETVRIVLKNVGALR